MELIIYTESVPEVEINLVFRFLFRLINLEFALPLPEFTEHFGIRIPVVGHLIFPTQKAVKKPAKVKLTREKLLKLIKSYWDYLKLFDKTNNYLERGIIIKKLMIDLTPGISDPFYFGIASGVLYCFLGSLYPLISKRVKKIEKYYFKVNPLIKAPFAAKIYVLVEIPWYHILATLGYLILLLSKQKIKGIIKYPLVQNKGEK